MKETLMFHKKKKMTSISNGKYQYLFKEFADLSTSYSLVGVMKSYLLYPKVTRMLLPWYDKMINGKGVSGFTYV